MKKSEKKRKNHHRFSHFLLGFLVGIFLPALFIWIYLKIINPFETSIVETVKVLFPSIMMGKILLLSMVPNMLGTFIFYKQDNFKIGIGIMAGVMPYLLMAVFML